MSRTDAVIIIPVYKHEIGRLELLALKRCVKVFADNPLTLVGPHSLDYSNYFSLSGRFSVEKFDDRYFKSIEGYSDLLLDEIFYKRFQNFNFMLIYQQDAFVFENQLDYWCRKGYDYIGAPWLDADGNWSGVGNGGFSLRRIASCLSVLQSQHFEDPDAYWEYLKAHIPDKMRLALRYPRKILNKLGMGRDVKGFLRGFIKKGCPEDMFWGLHAVRFYPSYAVAPEDEAIRFAVEEGLEMAMTFYGEKPPFGCHREWFLDMLDHYLNSGLKPRSEYEKTVWDLAAIAGISRLEAIQR